MNKIACRVLELKSYPRQFLRWSSILLQVGGGLCKGIVAAYCPYRSQNLVGSHRKQLEGYVLIYMQVFSRNQLWTYLGTAISEWQSRDKKIILMGNFYSEAPGLDTWMTYHGLLNSIFELHGYF